jgi:hypothetical protein
MEPFSEFLLNMGASIYFYIFKSHKISSVRVTQFPKIADPGDNDR